MTVRPGTENARAEIRCPYCRAPGVVNVHGATDFGCGSCFGRFGMMVSRQCQQWQSEDRVLAAASSPSSAVRQ